METAEKTGNNRYVAMDSDGKEIETFEYWLKLSMVELQKLGVNTTINENKIGVYISD